MRRKRSPISTLAERVKHMVQCTFDGRRIVIFSGGATCGDDDGLPGSHGDPAGRRIWLDHRTKFVPAETRAGPAFLGKIISIYS